jgi:hypothetical protein
MAEGVTKGQGQDPKVAEGGHLLLAVGEGSDEKAAQAYRQASVMMSPHVTYYFFVCRKADFLRPLPWPLVLT